LGAITASNDHSISGAETAPKDSMGFRAKQSERCERCRMRSDLCLCPWIPVYDLPTRLVLVMHYRELPKTTATGPLALAVLPNSELRVQGLRESILDFSDLDTPERRTLFLYLADDAPVLTREFLDRDPRPVTLVVPDGTWSQAARMGKRLPGLEHAERVRLPPGPRTQWGIRNEPHPHGLATFEAIARAMGIIETAAVQSGMEELFLLMVRKTIQGQNPAKRENREGEGTG
jgi:DTW domain-containing protein